MTPYDSDLTYDLDDNFYEPLMLIPQYPPTREDWQSFKQVIIGKYASVSLPLLVDFMKMEYGFDATARMYKQRFPEWGIFKYQKAANRRTTKTDQFGRHEDVGSSSAPMSRSSSSTTSTTPSSASGQNGNSSTTLLPSLHLHCNDPASCSHWHCIRDFLQHLRELPNAQTVHVPPTNIPAACPWSSSRPGSVKEVLLHVRSFSKSWVASAGSSHRHIIPDADTRAAMITSQHSRHCSHKASNVQCERCSWAEFDYGLAMLEQGLYADAVASFELGCRLFDLLLSRPSKLFIRNLINAFGSLRWECFPDSRRGLLQYLADMSTVVLGGHHSITIILHNLTCGNILAVIAEPALQIMADAFETDLHAADPDVLLIKRSLSVVLRRQLDFGKAEDILKDAIRVSTDCHGPGAKETRRCLRRLGHLYMQQCRWKETQEIYRQVLHTAPKRGSNESDWPQDEISVYTYHHLTQMAQAMGDQKMTRFWFYQELMAAIKRWGPTGDYTVECLQVAYIETPAEVLEEVVKNYPDIRNHLGEVMFKEKVVISKARWCAVRNLI